MKPITDEQARILRAAKEGRLHRNESCRHVIAGEARPVRAERERLQNRGMLDRDDPPRITHYGEQALEKYEDSTPTNAMRA